MTKQATHATTPYINCKVKELQRYQVTCNWRNSANTQHTQTHTKKLDKLQEINERAAYQFRWYEEFA